ncbi:MAG: PDZ domain-containing protein [Chloracidobacterium sp.]|nr:PDZ domain-containing protein [Chloracidobacterium sp.]MDW8216528.1 PDZ domain-containing protein [Acidobacteriota bacterium]
MSYRACALAAGCLVGSVLFFAVGQSQVVERLRSNPPARKADPTGVGQWLVTVTHHVTMGELTAVMEDAATAAVLDGACAPTDIVLTNVTTGVVVDAEGHVLTQLANLPPGHKNPTIVVQTHDRQTFRARFIGRDGATGMCVLHVPGLPVAPPPVASIAPPKPKFSVRETRTPGKPPTVRIMLPMFRPTTASTLHSRPEELPPLVWDEIVTDWETELLLAPPAEANCGVAVDERNRLVAIVQPKDRRLRVLPMEDVRRVTQRIIAAGQSVPHGWLGIEGKTLTTFPADERARLSVQSAYGVVVTAVVPGSPAEEAGLTPGDVILKADGRPLESRRELNEVVVGHAAGDVLELVVERAGKPRTCRVTLGSPEEAPTLKPPPAEHLAIGLITSDMTPQLAAFFGAAGGLLVTHVVPDSPAAVAGFRSGDVITAVDGQPVHSSEDLSAALLRSMSRDGETSVTLDIIRERQAQRLVVSLPAPTPRW